MDREKVIKDNAIRGLQSAIEISGALVHLRKEHAKAILELLKEQETELCDRCGRVRLKSKKRRLFGKYKLFKDEPETETLKADYVSKAVYRHQSGQTETEDVKQTAAGK